MAQKDIGNKVPLHTLKKTEDVMKFYHDWGKENKYDKDMSDWNYTGPKETIKVFKKYSSFFLFLFKQSLKLNPF